MCRSVVIVKSLGVVFVTLFAALHSGLWQHVQADNTVSRVRNSNISIIDDFLRRMENSRANNCSLENLGPGVVQSLAKDRFRQQAMTAVSRANLLTYMWKHHPQSLNNEAVLYMLVTNLVESDDQIFGAGNCYDLGQFNETGIFCPYGYRDQANGTIIVKDLAKTHTYDDINKTEYEWFHEIREMGTDIIGNIKFREMASFIFHLPNQNGPTTYETLLVKYEDGHWSLPYYDCGGGNIWMITYTVPFFGYDLKMDRYVFKGTSGIDIDLMKVDIDQCADERTGSERNVFADSHKCKVTTTCVPISGRGFKRGSYKCVCRDGFYFPLEMREALSDPSDIELFYYNGSDVEKEFDKKNFGEFHEYDTSFDCVKCAPGCDTCIDSSPCLYPINWILRSILLSVNSLFMLITVGWFVLVFMFRTLKPILAASPVLLYIILVGALLSYTPMIVHYFEPNSVLCVIQFWFRDIGFSIIYAAMLFKTWRISIVFRPTKHRNVRITDVMLLKRIAAVVSVFIALCSLRTIIDRPEVETSRHSSGMKTFSCSFDFWDYSIAACKVSLLFWGIYLTVSVRKTPTEFNESRFISWAIYNETIMAIFFNVSMFFLHSNADPDLFYILIFLHIQLTVTGTTAFLFASKVYHIIKFRKMAKNGERKSAMRFVRNSAGGNRGTFGGESEADSSAPVGVAALVTAANMRASLSMMPKSPPHSPNDDKKVIVTSGTCTTVSSGFASGQPSSNGTSSNGGNKAEIKDGKDLDSNVVDDESKYEMEDVPLTANRSPIKSRKQSLINSADNMTNQQVVTIFFKLPDTFNHLGMKDGI